MKSAVYELITVTGKAQPPEIRYVNGGTGDKKKDTVACSVVENVEVCELAQKRILEASFGRGGVQDEFIGW